MASPCEELSFGADERCIMTNRVRIQGYKSFRELNLNLSPLTVVFGPNASGKSNFLDALYFISQSVHKKNLKEAFDGHRGLPLESLLDVILIVSRDGDCKGCNEMVKQLEI